MAKADDEVLEIVTRMDTATNAIRDRIEKILAGQPLSSAARAAMDAELARLTALGADPENPVPPTP